MTRYQIRRLYADDLRFAQELRRIAQWNQTDADWLRLIDLAGEGCYLIECDGRPAGTATTTVYAGQLAWIGMILVHPAFRGRGLATALVRRCLDYLLDELKIPCVKLDATPAGRSLYGKLGFELDCELTRWVRRKILPLSAPAPNGSAVAEGIESGDSECWLALDRTVFGVDRGDFLRRLARDSRRAIRYGGPTACQGYGMLRDGAEASYLGPVVATDEAVGRALVTDLLNINWDLKKHSGGTVYWDIPQDNPAAQRLAEQLGFVRQRPLVRMWTGQQQLASDLQRQWAITGPETG